VETHGKTSISPNRALGDRQLGYGGSPAAQGMSHVEIPADTQQETTQKDTVIDTPVHNSASAATSEQDEREHERARRKSQVAARDRLAKLLMEREEAETTEG
jgi:hypothetical protein